MFFRITAAAAALFAITVLAITSTLFGDPRAPIHGILNEYGSVLLTIEVAVALSCGLLALAVDRRRIVDEANCQTSHAEVETLKFAEQSHDSSSARKSVADGGES